MEGVLKADRRNYIEQKGGLLMKLDMHCHVKEGSIDSKVSLDEYITKLK